MGNMEENFRHIKGWGVDADPENEPTYPMKHYTGDDHLRLNYERPPLQEPGVEILQSNERPGLPAVFGTSVPPSGFSGMIRRKAFTQSEGRLGHWMPLIMADRVNVIEGLIEDIRQGYIPNFYYEKGWDAELKHKPFHFIGKVVAVTVITAGIIALLCRKRKGKYS